MIMTRGCRACLQGVAREAAPAVEAALELRGGERAALHSQGQAGRQGTRTGVKARERPGRLEDRGRAEARGEGGTPLGLQLGRQGELFCLDRARTRGLAQGLSCERSPGPRV